MCFDECGWLEGEVFQVIEPYTAQNKDFKLGGGVDITTVPKELPNQLLYTSSASSVDSYFYQKYKDYSKQMILGSKQHFVSDINCEIMFNATLRGKVYPASLLTKEKVDGAMIENKEKALREYYNQFTTESSADCIIKRAMIARNSKVMPPLLFNDKKNKYISFVMAFDPARLADNAVVLIGGIYLDEKDGYKMDIVNLVNFMDANKKKKTPMRTPEQVQYLKKLILAYNGKHSADYENIDLLVDAGTGGGGVNICDYFMEDWYEEGHEGVSKYLHKGLIDKEYSADYVKKFPNAINKVKLLEPTKYKSVMYESLIEMITMDLITFPSDYDSKGYLTLLDIDEDLMRSTRKKIMSDLADKNVSKSEIDMLVEEKMSEINGATTRTYKLTPEEELSLSQIDGMKEELYNMTRKRRETKDAFELSTEKRNKMHDDKAYCMAMLGWWLSELRRSHITNKKRPKKENIAQLCPVKKATIRKTFM